MHAIAYRQDKSDPWIMAQRVYTDQGECDAAVSVFLKRGYEAVRVPFEVTSRQAQTPAAR